MNGIHLTDYHNAVKAHLLAKCGFLKSVDFYLDAEQIPECPFLLFGVTDWDNVGQNNAGQKEKVLTCKVMLVTEYSALDARNAAMVLDLAIDGTRFGMSQTDEAVVTGAYEDAEIPELDGFETWSIEFKHKVPIGPSLYNDPIFEGDLLISHTPSDNADDYKPIDDA